MVIDRIGDYVCRTATMDDVEAVYAILEPKVCDKTRHKFQYATQQRKLRSNIEFYITKKQSLIVTKDGEVLGVYLGTEGFALHLATKEPSRRVMLLLMYHTFCSMHSRFSESRFVPLRHKNAYVFRSSVGAHLVVRYEDVTGVVTLEAKELLCRLYSKVAAGIRST